MTNKPPFTGERVRLGDVCELIMGQSPSSDSYNKEGEGLPFYQGNADFGKTSPTATTWCTDPKKRAQSGDVLISVRAPIGAINVATEECCIGRGLAAIRPASQSVDTEYLMHVLMANRTRLEAMGTGSTFKAIGKQTLTNFPIPLLRDAERETLCSQFEAILKCRDESRRQLALLDGLVKSRFVEMFGDPIGNPRGWEVSTIKGTSLTYGDGPFGSNLKSSDYVESGVRVIRLGNIQLGSFSNADESYVSWEKFDKLRKYACKPGEVVIATLGDPLLRACLVPEFAVPAIHKADCMYYETDKTRVLPTFAVWAINHPSMLKRAYEDMHGQTRARINSTQTGNLPMIVPPLPLQRAFADFVAEVDKSRFVVQRQIEQLQTLYDSLAQDYFG